jgi:hypothetical protein
MTVVSVAAAAVLAAALQVTVAPLFAVAGTTADFGVIAIVVTLLAAGPRAAMVMTVAFALALGLASTRSPGLLLAGYPAILLTAYALERYGLPGDFPRLLAAAAAGGAGVRLLLAFGAFASGAAFAPVPLMRDVLLPGLVIDAVLVALAYLPMRLLGHGHPQLSLERRGWLP